MNSKGKPRNSIMLRFICAGPIQPPPSRNAKKFPFKKKGNHTEINSSEDGQV